MSTQHVNRQLFYLFMCNLAIVFIGMGLFPVLPLYAMAFGASPAMAGLFMASTYAAISGGTLLGGPLASYVGRKRLFIATGLLSLPAVILLGQAKTLWQVVLLTDLIWFAGGIGLTLTSVFTGLVANSQSRGRSFSLLHLASPIGALIGGTTVSQLVAWKGYGLLFVVLGLVWSVWPLVGILVQDRPAATPAKGVANQGGKTAVPLGGSFYVLILVTLLSAATINVSRLGTSFSMQTLHFSASAVASTAAISGLVTIPVAFFIGTLSDRLGRRRFLSLSYLLAAAGALSLIVATQLWQFWLAATLLLVARSVSAGIGAALATDILAPQELERGLSWLNTAGWITGTIAFAGAGQAMETIGAPALYIMAAVLASVAALQLRRIHYREAPVAAAGRPATFQLSRKRLAARVAGAWRLVLLAVIGGLLAGCLPGPSANQTPRPDPLPATPPVTVVVTPTMAAAATATAGPSATPQPPATPEPTSTPQPPATPEPPDTSQPEQIRFAPGATSAIVTDVMPGQSQKIYLLWAEAGQTISVSVTSPDVSVLFHMHGRDDGAVYKHLLDGEMSWQGVLPLSQDYVLTLDALGDGMRSYTIEVSLITTKPPDGGAGPLYPVVDAATGYLLGGWQNNRWLDAAGYAPLIADGERPYILYGLKGEAGVASGQPPLSQGICPQPTVSLAPIMPGTLGLVSRWNGTPRLPLALSPDNDSYRQVVAEAVDHAGLAGVEVFVDRVLRIDLEGDGIDEVLIVANRLTQGNGQPAVAVGDYAAVLLRQVSGSQVVTVPLRLDVYRQAAAPAFPWRYDVLALADLNGNGRLEIVVEADRYEGRQVTVFEIDGAAVHAVLQSGCIQ